MSTMLASRGTPIVLTTGDRRAAMSDPIGITKTGKYVGVPGLSFRGVPIDSL
jgi:hypothetical protein